MNIGVSGNEFKRIDCIREQLFVNCKCKIIKKIEMVKYATSFIFLYNS